MKLRNHLLLGLLVGLALAVGLGLSHLARASEPLKPMNVPPVRPLEFQSSNVNFQAVDMVSGNDGWAVGGNLIYHYDGTTWQNVATINDVWLKDIDMVSANEGWAVGYQASLGYSLSSSVILYYDGNSWQTFPTPAGKSLTAVDMISQTEGWATGLFTVMYYNGVAWQNVSPTDVWQAVDVDIVSSSSVWVLNSGNANNILHYNGSIWQTSTVNTYLEAIDMLSDSDGWAASYDGEIFHYNGATWTSVKSPTGTSFHDIFMVSTIDGWAVGDNGTILHYNGANWQTVGSPTGEHLYGISMISAADGWAVGDNGTLLHYDGSSWQQYGDIPTQLDLSVHHIEVRQIFLTDKSPYNPNDPTTSEKEIPLIAEKPTLVRVYVNVNGANVTNLDIVRANLYVQTETGHPTLFSKQINRVSLQDLINPQRDDEDLNNSINFLVTDLHFPFEGNITFWAEIDPGNEIDEVDESNNVGGHTTKLFHPGHNLSIAWTAFLYDNAGVTKLVDSRIPFKGARFLQKIYPVGLSDVEYYLQYGGDFATVDKYFSCQLTCSAWSEYIKPLNKLWKKLTIENGWRNGGLPPDRLYGWVPHDVVANPAIAVGIADALWKFGGTGRVATGWDSAIPIGDTRITAAETTFAHEIGHLLNEEGLKHAYCLTKGVQDQTYPNDSGKIDAYGIDPIEYAHDPNNYDPVDSAYDIMSYCPYFWISPHNYLKIIDGFSNVNSLETSNLITTKEAQSQLLVSGLVYSSTTSVNLQVDFDPFYVITSTVAADISTGTDFCLQQYDTHNSILDNRCFDLGFVNPESGESIDADYFTMSIPHYISTAQVVLTHLGNPIGNVNVSANAPSIELIYPNGGEAWSGTDTYSIRWTANDKDDDPLFYDLSYSDDSGISWIPLTTDITSTHHLLDVSNLPGGSNILLRVAASDGVNTTYDVSDNTFTVGRKPPAVIIIDPDPDTNMPLEGQLFLQGIAYDLEDENIDKNTLHWTSSIDGDLGTGDHILVTALSPGRHLITLSATDSDDNTATDTVNVTVGVTDLYLPLILKNQTSTPPPAAQPDLVAAFSLSPDQSSFNAGEPVQINVTVTNQGTARAEPFWVDFYINPATPPTQAGTFWYDTCGLEPCYGLTWEAHDGLDPGESITFTSTPGNYHDRYTIWPGYFAAGTSDLYLYVDSYGSLGGNGAIQESSESNNRAELHGLTVAGNTPTGVELQSIQGIPARSLPGRN